MQEMREAIYCWRSLALRSFELRLLQLRMVLVIEVCGGWNKGFIFNWVIGLAKNFNAETFGWWL